MSKLVDALRSEDIIHEVKKNRILWDTSHVWYQDKDERTNAWFSIVNTFFPDCQEKTDSEKFEIESALRKRWKNIRTCYSREVLKRSSQGGVLRRKCYRHFETLRFLDKSAKSVSSTAEVIGGSRKETIPEKPSLATRSVQRVVKTTEMKRKKREENIKGENPKNEILYEPKIPRYQKEADVLFLMSLVPDLQKVPESRKMKLKLEILTAISKAHRPLPSCSQHRPVEDSQHQQTESEDQDLLAFQEVMISPESSTFVKMEPPETFTSEEERMSAEDSENEEELSL